ncbi:hypothetical protein EBZ37_13140 [bacterium]|nr:hypothetical protein [bacterium]
MFLDYLFRKSAFDQRTFEMITPSEFLTRHDTHQISQPSASSWGNEGHWSVWLEGSNAWIYPHLHMATVRMIEMAGKSPVVLAAQVASAGFFSAWAFFLVAHLPSLQPFL